MTLGQQTLPLRQGVGGTLGALLDYRSGELEPLRDALNTLATDIADGINGLLAQGLDLGEPAQPGQPLFSYDPLAPAGSLKVDPAMTAEGLAFATAGGGPGDNRNLLELLDQKDLYYDGYTSILGGLAVRSGQVSALAEASTELRLDAVARRDSVSGVNLDEEAMQLMKYIQAYQANAKVVGVADDIFASLWNMF